MTATTTYPKSTQWRTSADPAGVAQHGTAPALIAGDDVDAISMPAAFGALVLAELEIMMLAGPIVADDGSWVFLTQRADTRQPVVPGDLLPLGVRAVPAGTPLATGDRPAQAPAIWWTVIGAARRVAYRTRLVA
jgi:hypothetical protein